MQPENNYFCILKMTDYVWKAKKRKESALVTGNGSPPPEVSLIWSNDSYFFLTNPKEKDRVLGRSI